MTDKVIESVAGAIKKSLVDDDSLFETIYPHEIESAAKAAIHALIDSLPTEFEQPIEFARVGIIKDHLQSILNGDSND